ncbi:MAG TPA: T9SS type A sorting domain-containing protein [Chitinophagaceae bacterium]|nr:T9SS type A sorting domain-containing protein [Chitinophagaceae bacterium]
MRKSLHLTFMLAGSVFLSGILSAQQADRFAYSVTDVQDQGGINWNYLRKLNLVTGEYSQVLLNGNDVSFRAFDAVSKKQFATPQKDVRFGELVNAPFGTGVAAIAYDKKNNRLYYTPMFVDQLRYVDLRSMNVFYLADRGLTGKPQKSPDQGNIVTRMTIASDGYGYAMTNDATQLIRFSIGKKFEITDLGSIVDDPANKGVSIHNSCSSFGGDMIADDDGNLYVFSARNHVFKVNIETKVATHLGIVTGLPNGFTINGAAVNEKNQVVVSTAMKATSYYTVDHKSLTASPYTIAGTVWNSSDLANSNLLATASKNKNPVGDVISRNMPENSGDGKIGIFPNPVTNNQFVIQFKDLEIGNYTILVTDVTGRQVLQQVVNLGGENQSQTVKLDPSASKGIYLVKVTDQSSRSVFSTKMIVQ